MKREHFLSAAKALSNDQGLAILVCLRKKWWAIASDVAQELRIHISTASKDLSILYDSGLLERRMSKRKTRPAHEYRLKSNRIILDLSLDDSTADLYEEVCRLYVHFFDRLFLKAKKMGWGNIETVAAKELGDANATVAEIVSREFRAIKEPDGITEVRSAFRHSSDKVRRVFEEGLGQAATDRLFDAAAMESSEFFPSLAERYDLMADVGVITAD